MYKMYEEETTFNALDPINKQIDITAKNLNILIKKLNEEKTKEVICSFTNKFCNSQVKHYLWEGFCSLVNKGNLDCVAVSNDDAWSWIDQYIENDAIMFFNPYDEKISYVFTNGKDIVNTLAECYNFEFYITNNDFDYILCFNHHRVLYACGDASEWLKLYKKFRL